jgi:DNA-binding Lrp family transcriptional regulator
MAGWMCPKLLWCRPHQGNPQFDATIGTQALQDRRHGHLTSNGYYYYPTLRCRGVDEIGYADGIFVLINADLGAEEDLLKKLREIQNVKDVYVVYGVYDIVARVEADTMEKVKETITWNIRRLDKVRSTLTMIVVEA